MHYDILLFAVVLMWIAVVAGTCQRIFEMPKWFADPPASFELIRRQSKRARLFWIPLSVLFIVSAMTSLILYWDLPDVRNNLVYSLACFGLTGALSGIYFVKEVIAFTKIPVNAPRTPELIKRTRTWLKWTGIRDVLQLLAAIFMTFAISNVN